MTSKVPFRVVLTSRGVSRKFFTLFQGRDGSLYIHPNRENGKPWKTPSVKNFGSGMKLDFKDATIPDFEFHKISFHPSGYIHLTNKHGKRYHDGTRGPTFEEMDDPYLLCILVPSKLDEMPVFEEDEKCMLVNLVVPDNIGPFFITVALLKGEPSSEKSGDPPIVRLILPLESRYKLTFALRTVKQTDQNTPANWPPFPFFLLRTERSRPLNALAD